MFQAKQQGEVYLDKQGYYRIVKTNPDDPFWRKEKLHHRWMMEIKLGRRLTNNEVVHHINGKKQDNRIDNLQMMAWKEHEEAHSPPNTIQKLKREHCIHCEKEWLKVNGCEECYIYQRIEDLNSDLDEWDDDDEDWEFWDF